MLPVITGFIFPDGSILDSGIKGHNRSAFRYIVEHGFIERYSKYESETSGGEDDFLIECLGAVKVCHYCGFHYIYVPKLHYSYIDVVEKMYKKAGYIVRYFSASINFEISIPIKSYNRNPYNKTVVTSYDESGNKKYIYNPNRIGD